MFYLYIFFIYIYLFVSMCHLKRHCRYTLFFPQLDVFLWNKEFRSDLESILSRSKTCYSACRPHVQQHDANQWAESGRPFAQEDPALCIKEGDQIYREEEEEFGCEIGRLSAGSHCQCPWSMKTCFTFFTYAEGIIYIQISSNHVPS